MGLPSLVPHNANRRLRHANPRNPEDSLQQIPNPAQEPAAKHSLLHKVRPWKYLQRAKAKDKREVKHKMI
jgi:hypothetical protein